MAALLALAPGCGLYYGIGKGLGLISSPTLSVRTEMPPDFKLSVAARDVADPPTDYTYSFDRSGKATYDVTVRAPRRRHQEGDFEITEDQVVSLWKAVQEAKFDELPPSFPDAGDGTDRTQGVQTFYVYADGADWRVETRYVANATLQRLRDAALNVVRPDIRTASDAAGERPKQFIGDTATHMFHLPDCSQLKNVPQQQRESFETPYDALNFNYQPCPECRPMNTK